METGEKVGAEVAIKQRNSMSDNGAVNLFAKSPLISGNSKEAEPKWE